MSVTTAIEEITPQEALKILEQNKNNRRIRQRNVDTYARDMKTGRWKLNGSALLFNGHGGLMDGQHRLLACVLANKPFTTLVVRGLSETSHSTIDTGAPRTAGDELRWRGESNANQLASVLGMVWRYDNNVVTDQWVSPSRNDILSLLGKRPEIRESVKASTTQARGLGIRQTTVAVVHHLIYREHGVLVADLFLRHLDLGINYGPGDPCLALRNYALNVSKATSVRPTGSEWLAVAIKAANAFLTGREVKHLRWRRVGAGREAFPSLATSDEAGDVLGDYGEFEDE